MNQTYTIGSAPGADVQLKDASVSPVHAKVFVQNGQSYIEDLGQSPLGTFIGELRLKVAKISAKDRVTLGNSPLLMADVFEWDASGLLITGLRDTLDFSAEFAKIAIAFKQYKEEKQRLSAGSLGGAIIAGIPYVGGVVGRVQQREKQRQLDELEANIQSHLLCPKCRKHLLAWLPFSPQLFANQGECPHRCGAKYQK